jgi:hypothetical protein
MGGGLGGVLKGVYRSSYLWNMWFLGVKIEGTQVRGGGTAFLIAPAQDTQVRFLKTAFLS